MYDELFYKRLSQLRIKRGVSARDMSLSIGQNAGYINSLENHKGLPSMAVFFYICDYLGITPKDFFDDDISHPHQLNELVKGIESFDEERLNLLISLTKYMKSK